VLKQVCPLSDDRADIKESGSAKEAVAETMEAEARVAVSSIPVRSFL
jgi:hypothetical protein